MILFASVTRSTPHLHCEGNNKAEGIRATFLLSNSANRCSVSSGWAIYTGKVISRAVTTFLILDTEQRNSAKTETKTREGRATSRETMGN